MSPSTKAPVPSGVRDLCLRRGALFARLDALAPADFAREIDDLARSAASGNEAARDAMVAVASFVAYCADGRSDAEISAAVDAARERELELAGAILGTHGARRSLPARGRLSEVPLSLYSPLTGWPRGRWPDESVSEWQMISAELRSQWFRSLLVRTGDLDSARRHHDPRFIARLLDQRWLIESDVVVIASRRPTTPALQLAIATRDRWLERVSVRRALLENPFTPTGLAAALGATVPARA